MLYEALVEEIKRKAFIAKSMGQEFTDENYLEEIEKAMGRRAVMGEVRTWRGENMARKGIHKDAERMASEAERL